MEMSLLMAAAETPEPGFFMSIGGYVWALIGVALAVMLAGIGSAYGVRYVASAGIGLMSEEPKRFMPCLVLSLLPSTQGIYGFVIAFMMFGNASVDMSFQSGMSLFAAALPVGVIGLISGMCQGRVAAAGIALAAKQPKHWSKAMIVTLTVEMFALFGFLISIFMLQQ